MANVAEMLTIKRPDLLEEVSLGGDLLILSSLQIEPKFRGNELGHAVLKSILCTVGRSAALVIVEAAPILSRNVPEEGNPGHDAAKAALRHYWEGLGFQSAYGDSLALDAMADVLE